VGIVVAVFFQLPFYLVPLGSGFLAALPFLWLLKRKHKRIKKFVDGMPEAVELIGRALRAGHGLASGLHLVSEEMQGPIAHEFNRVFEEQNLGIPIELSLRNMADRIPVMDVRFFVIAIVIQRATGGDLAEVLDKIGRLIRQRYELLGHVKALTAEGRLSGIVLFGPAAGAACFSLVLELWLHQPPIHDVDRYQDAGDHRRTTAPGGLDDQQDRGNQGVTSRDSLN
jgi:tight adherence protein B